LTSTTPHLAATSTGIFRVLSSHSAVAFDSPVTVAFIVDPFVKLPPAPGAEG
jgi:hypothetical protein